MGTKNNPGKFDCYAVAHDDEPLFTLLARDPQAPQIVREWALGRMKAIADGDKPLSDAAMVVEAIECAVQMEEWRRFWLDQARQPEKTPHE